MSARRTRLERDAHKEAGKLAHTRLTVAQRRILAAACSPGGINVGGRNMKAVDNLEKAGLITVRWRIEGVRFAGPTRWHGDVKATKKGRRAL